MSIAAPAGRGNTNSPSPSRSPRSGASSSATAASISGPDTIPASTIGTKRGVACSYTSTAGFSSLIALKYACERTVAGVAITPTRRLRVARAAAAAPGRTTPSTGRS